MKEIMTEENEIKDIACREKIFKLEAFKGDYSAISLDYLLMYVLEKMEENNIHLSFSNLTVSAWRVFPDKFSLFGYPEYPDSNRIQTGQWHCKYKNKRWINGTPTHWLITEKGRQAIETAKELLSLEKTPKTRHFSKSRKQEKLLEQVKKTRAYIKYSTNKEITKFDLYELLQCTLDSSSDVLKENYDTLVVLATESSSHEIAKFLKSIKENFEEIKNA